MAQIRRLPPADVSHQRARLAAGAVSFEELADDCAPRTQITWAGDDVPIALVQGPFEAGPVDVATLACALDEGDVCPLVFFGQRYELSATNFQDSEEPFATSENLPGPARTFDLHVTSEGLSRTIRAVVAIEWMGDLDQDGRLDVFVRIHPRVCDGWELFLSGECSERGLFMHAASFLPACLC